MEALQMYHSLMCEQPSYSLPVASQPFPATMMLPQQQQPAAVAVTQPFATFPRPAANISFEQVYILCAELSLLSSPKMMNSNTLHIETFVGKFSALR
jgi:hypothetical protein